MRSSVSRRIVQPLCKDGRENCGIFGYKSRMALVSGSDEVQ